MATVVYPPAAIINTVLNDFFPYRGLALGPLSLAPGKPVPTFSYDRIVSDMEQNLYVRLDARREVARGDRYWVVVFVLSGEGKYSHHSFDLRKLIEGVETEHLARTGKLDEIIVIAEKEFFSRKNLTDVIEQKAAAMAAASASIGSGIAATTPNNTPGPILSAYPYYNFAFRIPGHVGVAAHRLLTSEDVGALIAQKVFASVADIPVIFTTDAPIVWLGGREGQVVEITRDSQTAGAALYWRRIERGSIVLPNDGT